MDVISSTLEFFDDWKFEVSPNPSIGNIKVTLDFSENKKWKLKIYNSIGSEIYEIESPRHGMKNKEFWIND